MSYDGLQMQPHHTCHQDAVEEFERTGRGYFIHGPTPAIQWSTAMNPSKWHDAAHSVLIKDLLRPPRAELLHTPRGSDIWYQRFIHFESIIDLLHSEREANLYIGDLGVLDGLPNFTATRDQRLLDFIDKLSDPAPPRPSTLERWLFAAARCIDKPRLRLSSIHYYSELAEAIDAPRGRCAPPAKLSRILTEIRSIMEEICQK